MTQPKPKNSDLGVRVASAVVMVAVAGTALWLGGWVWTAFVAAVALGVLWEWWGLVRGSSSTSVGGILWIVGGVGYVAVGSCMLLLLRNGFEGASRVLLIVGAVICTDIGAYFAGRAIGGPKIAPAISPSKTWAGLFGGMLGASLAVVLIATAWDAGLCEAFYPQTTKFGFDGPCSGYISMYPTPYLLPWAAIVGSLIAIVAQAGDFFESWMKRRAGVKDSSNLIPGHGGLFDRVDGLLAVCFVIGVLMLTEPA
jgi:phosphatidate cytidylyltransferase